MADANIAVDLRVNLRGSEALDRLRESLAQLDRNTRNASDAGDRHADSLRRASGAASGADKTTRTLAQSVQDIGKQLEFARNAVAAWVAALGAIRSVQSIVQIADDFKLLEARIKASSYSQEEFTGAMDAVRSVAAKTGSPLKETATLFLRINDSTRTLGLSQQEVADTTQVVAQTLRISGATAEESAGALLQFGQALAAGVLRGDEFNSVVSQAPRLSRALAESLGVSTGELRRMAEQGQLTADAVVKALLNQKSVIEAEYAQLPLTVGEAWTLLSNSFAEYVNRVNDSTGATGTLAAAIKLLAENLSTVANVLSTIALALLPSIAARLLPLMASAAAAMGAVFVASINRIVAGLSVLRMSLTAAALEVGTLNTSFAVLAAGMVGYKFGETLRNEFDIVREAGDLLGASLGAVQLGLGAIGALMVEVFTQGPARAMENFRRNQALVKDTFDATVVSARSFDSAVSTAFDKGASAAQLAAAIDKIKLGLQEAAMNSAKALGEAIKAIDTQIGELDKKIADATAQARQALDGFAAARKTLEDQLAAQAQETDAALAQASEAMRLSMEQAQLSTQAQIKITTDMAIQSATTRAQMANDAATQIIAALQREESTRLALAAAEGKTEMERRQNAISAAQAILQEQIRTWQAAASTYKTHIDGLIAEERRHRDAIVALERERENLNMDVESRIREIRRRSMTQEQADNDRAAEAYEYQMKAREALRTGDLEKAREYAQRSRQLYEQAASSRSQETIAISGIRSAQEILNQTIDKEQDAHRGAAAAAAEAAKTMQQGMADVQAKLDATVEALRGLTNAKINLSTEEASAALQKLSELLPPKDYLFQVKADLAEAEQKILDYRKNVGEQNATVQVTATITEAQKALDWLKEYADTAGAIDLKMKTDSADTALSAFRTRIETLNTLKTESQHTVKSNADDVIRYLDEKLNNHNTSSTHTVYVQQVDQHAAGGMVGVARYARGGSVGVRRFAGGGGVAWPLLRNGRVPGVGNQDSEPYRLQAGSYVIKKAAVQKYGQSAIGRIAGSVARFADGGLVGKTAIQQALAQATNVKDLTALKKALELKDKMQQIEMLRAKYNAILSKFNGIPMGPGTFGVGEMNSAWQALQDLEGRDYYDLIGQSAEAEAMISLDPEAKRIYDDYKNAWYEAGRQYYLAIQERNAQLAQKQRTGDIQNFIASRDFPKRFAQGGAASDTVPALLTPGEFVVRREAVQKLGVGMLDAINNMKLPPSAIRGYANGGMVASTTSAAPSPSDTRTIRLELNVAGQPVTAYTDASNEAALLDALRRAKSRAVAS